jgi:poly-gamma-glutamate synthesis protein (capsule biosynthesis protein)
MPARLLLALAACRGAAPPGPAPLPATGAAPSAVDPGSPVEVLASARIGAVGDVMMHGMVQRTAREAATPENHGGFDVLFDHVDEAIRPLDLAFANLETPIAPQRGSDVQPMVFNAPPVLLASLSSVGFDVLSFANNHVYDQGRAGMMETVEQLEASGLAFVGAGRTCAEAQAARMLTPNGIHVAIIGATDLYNDDLNAGPDEPCVATLGEEWVLAEAARARSVGAELVVLSVHWGEEYVTAPRADHVELAHRLVQGGVDVILGHHPHVLQPIEVVDTADGRRALIVYSLGNFISNQSAWYVPGVHKVGAGNPRDGLLATFLAVRKRYGRGARTVERVEVAELEWVPLWTLNDDTGIRVVPTRSRLEQLEAALPAATSDDDIVALSREIDEMRRRLAQVEGILLPPLR